MKKTLILLLASCFVLQNINAQTSGGPDAFGYTWLHSNAIGGPVYNWIDILPVATEMNGFSDDNSVGWVQMGFDFHYYWTDYNQVRIGSNGWISFNNVGNIAHGFPLIPTPGGNADNYVAPFMVDLNFAGETNPGRAYYWSNNVDTFIVTYYQIPFWVNAQPDFTGSNTFQVIFTNTDSSITFQYAEQTGFVQNTNLNDIVIGIENVTGSIGLQCTLDNYPVAPAAIKFYYPETVTLEIPDLKPAWNQNDENAGLFFFKGSATYLQSNIANVGNTTVDAPSSAIANFLDEQNISSYSSTVTLGSVAPDADTTINFDGVLTLDNPGDYTYRVSVSNSSDLNTYNNNNDFEIVVVDSANGEVVLSYVPADSTFLTFVSWNGGGGNSGAAIKIIPPYYPATIVGAEFFVMSNLGGFNPIPHGFTANIVTENVQGQPAVIQTSESVSNSQLYPSQWNRIDFTNPYTVTSGPVYVNWIMGGDSIALGTHPYGPISNRSLEILDGDWAEYRQGANEDLGIRVIISSAGAQPDTTVLGIGDAVSENDVILYQNYPNPAESITTVEFYVPAAASGAFNLYNTSGSLINTISFSSLTHGKHRVDINTAKLAAGIYYYTLRVKDKVYSKKMIVNR